jgi:NADP-dependent aldehyde dehydrogenase
MRTTRPARERVLVTGAAGHIGTVIRPRLARPNRVLRLLDTAEMAPAHDGEQVELLHGSVTDMHVVEQACRDVTSVSSARSSPPQNGPPPCSATWR